MFQLRTYTLASEEAAKTYLDIHWARHLKSLSKYGIKVHGVFLAKETNLAQVIALVSYEEGASVSEVNAAYMKSPDLRADMEGFNMEDIIRVDEILLEEAKYFQMKDDSRK